VQSANTVIDTFNIMSSSSLFREFATLESIDVAETLGLLLRLAGSIFNLTTTNLTAEDAMK
jgi:hypothetical protein